MARRGLRGRRNLAAAIVTITVLLVAVIPLAGLAALLVVQIGDGVQWLRETIQSEGVWGLVERLPPAVQRAAGELLQLMPQPEQQLQKLAGQQGGQAAAAVGGILAATGTVVFQTVMMLIAFFFFLTDGARLVHWVDARVPLRPGQFRALMEDFRQTSVSVLLATVGTAAIQAAAALVGFLIARAPNPLFLVFATFLLALVPAVGGAAMVVAVGLLLLGTGHGVAGTFLVAWGAAVVSNLGQRRPALPPEGRDGAARRAGVLRAARRARRVRRDRPRGRAAHPHLPRGGAEALPARVRRPPDQLGAGHLAATLRRPPAPPQRGARCRSNAARTFAGTGIFFQPGTSMQQITVRAIAAGSAWPGRKTL